MASSPEIMSGSRWPITVTGCWVKLSSQLPHEGPIAITGGSGLPLLFRKGVQGRSLRTATEEVGEVRMWECDRVLLVEVPVGCWRERGSVLSGGDRPRVLS